MINDVDDELYATTCIKAHRRWGQRRTTPLQAAIHPELSQPNLGDHGLAHGASSSSEGSRIAMARNGTQHGRALPRRASWASGT
jgi:hypothetical protein